MLIPAGSAAIFIALFLIGRILIGLGGFGTSYFIIVFLSGQWLAVIVGPFFTLFSIGIILRRATSKALGFAVQILSRYKR